jgi:ribosomal protein RSM22 (predicted rRNA methylase)
MRLTITKSQGKQAYYDARKSKWGDIFPHPPKNRALVRFEPDSYKKPSSGEDIGKRGDTLFSPT